MRKLKFLTLLLSVAILLSFMPAMAFSNAPAGTRAAFNVDYTKLTVAAYIDADSGEEVPQCTYNTVRTYDETTGVIVGEKPGSKYDKAIKLGVNIYNEDDIDDLIS